VASTTPRAVAPSTLARRPCPRPLTPLLLPTPTPFPDDRAAVEELGQKLRRGALKVGFLMKCGDHNKTWHRRWFILGMDCVGYFESDLGTAPLGAPRT
jgi:hypothetical protein